MKPRTDRAGNGNTGRSTLLAALLVAMAMAVAVAVWVLTGRDSAKELTLAEARTLANPVPESPAVLAEARTLYTEHCQHCHGEGGAGDGGEAMMYDPPPADFTRADKMGNVRDGELFYKITEGRRPMPSFKRVLKDEQRWKLVRLVRTFAASPGVKQE